MAQQPPSTLVLTVLNGDERGRIIVLNLSRAAVLGRGEDADVQLSAADLRLSRRHARLECDTTVWTLTRLAGATNQPRVNGQTGDRLVITHGAEICLGETLLRVSFGLNHASAWHCERCPTDVTRDANLDGRAFELSDVATYRCAAHREVDPSLTGRTVSQYQLCSLLGRGGAGVVYRVYDTRTGRVLALKQLVDLQNVELIRRFDQEIGALMKLQHMGIVRFVECGVETDGIPYLVTEYAPEGNVSDLARQHAWRVPIALAVDIVGRVLDALRFIHKRGIIHRDIKPENVLLRRVTSSDGTVAYVPKLADFGLLKQIGGIRLTRPKDASGSYEFMPPEQPLNFSGLGVQADIYSLGATLYFMLSGRLPLDLEDEAPEEDVLRHVIAADRISIRERLPDIPRQLAAVVDRACHRDVVARFETAEAFQAALYQAV